VAEKTTLHKARISSKIEDFITEHKADPNCDLDKLDSLIERSTPGSEKTTRPASLRMHPTIEAILKLFSVSL